MDVTKPRHGLGPWMSLHPDTVLNHGRHYTPTRVFAAQLSRWARRSECLNVIGRNIWVGMSLGLGGRMDSTSRRPKYRVVNKRDVCMSQKLHKWTAQKTLCVIVYVLYYMYSSAPSPPGQMRQCRKNLLRWGSITAAWAINDSNNCSRPPTHTLRLPAGWQ
jgi:hypothetical protein